MEAHTHIGENRNLNSPLVIAALLIELVILKNDYILAAKETPMIKSELKQLIAKYQTIGIMEAGELLLRPKDALKFAHELEKIEVDILGVDLWHQSGDSIVQDLSSMDMSTYAMGKENRHHEKMVAVARLIEILPADIAYLSFVWA